MLRTGVRGSDDDDENGCAGRICPIQEVYERKFYGNLETLKQYDKKELFTITGRNFYKNDVILTLGKLLRFVKEIDNEFDKNAIAVFAQDEQIGYVANKDYTKFELTSSVSEL